MKLITLKSATSNDRRRVLGELTIDFCTPPAPGQEWIFESQEQGPIRTSKVVAVTEHDTKTTIITTQNTLYALLDE